MKELSRMNLLSTDFLHVANPALILKDRLQFVEYIKTYLLNNITHHNHLIFMLILKFICMPMLCSHFTNMIMYTYMIY